MVKFTFLKSQCVLCGAKVSFKTSLCQACRADLPYVVHACKVCALPMEADTENSLCGQCISHKTYVDYAVNLFYYESPIDYLISQMKFQQQLSSAAILADLLKVYMANHNLDHGLPEAFMPVPLHKKRLVKRGFNQSLEIIKPLVKLHNIPILNDVVERSRNTLAQKDLNKQARLKNIAGCFTLLTKPQHSHIVIIDDVVTTGATTNELARILKSAGVTKVGVWSLARAELNN